VQRRGGQNSPLLLCYTPPQGNEVAAPFEPVSALLLGQVALVKAPLEYMNTFVTASEGFQEPWIGRSEVQEMCDPLAQAASLYSLNVSSRTPVLISSVPRHTTID
jgi:hypothetical protein